MGSCARISTHALNPKGLEAMSLSKEILDGVNILSGSARDEYGSFVCGWSIFMKILARHLKEPVDDVIRETYDDVSVSEFVKVLRLSGWEPNTGESIRDFDSRLKALPIFKQLELQDDNPEKLGG
jgi:hypothetical protein